MIEHLSEAMRVPDAIEDEATKIVREMVILVENNDEKYADFIIHFKNITKNKLMYATQYIIEVYLYGVKEGYVSGVPFHNQQSVVDRLYSVNTKPSIKSYNSYYRDAIKADAVIGKYMVKTII